MKKNFFLIVIVLVFCSCKKNTDSLSTPQVDVYVAGWESNGTSIVAKYWKNGQANTLTSGPDWAWANSIDVAGSDVYVAGYEFNRLVNVAKYWKNGQAITLGVLFGCGQICGFLAGKTPANGLLSVAGINSTAISFELTEAENVLTKVYDATGRLVRTIVKSNMSESYQQIECDNKDESGKPVPAGVYVLRMTAKNYSEA